MAEQQPTPAEFNRLVIDEFRANGGRVGGMFEGAPLVLLTTTGARSGRPHTNPAVYLRDGDRVLVFASNAGLPKNPGWYHNLVADPRVMVTIGTADGGTETYAAEAVPLEGDERDRLYAVQAELDPAFAAYQAGTTRVIPVIALHRLNLAADPARNRAIGEHLRTVHDRLRRELASVRRDVDAFLAGHAEPYAAGTPAPRLGEELARHCLTFCGALHAHHTNENGAFTVFEKEFPELAPALDRLRREHHLVAQALTDLQALLADLTSGTATADADRLRAELERLARDLEEHFAYEERHLLPALGA
ncbi:nitroreductase/quinone reductase family protein [Streptosporangium amethystogenes subsp. fukuiense]|uniref:Nitroreductase/quinone reductase family protein n=3 Tax=Streptosporangium amethystogenes TaxID=2002 RepID=A0ABW2T0K8_9ACTN